jgi:hypothetical protein
MIMPLAEKCNFDSRQAAKPEMKDSNRKRVIQRVSHLVILIDGER